MSQTEQEQLAKWQECLRETATEKRILGRYSGLSHGKSHASKLGFDVNPCNLSHNLSSWSFLLSISKESHMPVKSTSSVELGTLYRQIEVSAFVHRICTGQWEKLHFKIHEEYAHMNNKDCRQGSIEIICQKVSITLENYFQLFSPFLSSPSLILEWPIESPLLRCERWSWESVRGLLLCLLT